MTAPSKYKLRNSLKDHFVYEVDELYWCKKLWTMRVDDPEFRVRFTNMNLEHTLLHARGLYEFYYRLVLPPNVYNEKDKPRANMFVKSFGKPPFTREITRKFEEKVNDQIAHYGLGRTSAVTKKFSVGQTVAIANRLLKITKGFLDDLEIAEGGFFFRPPLRALQTRIDSYIQFDPFKPSVVPLPFTSTSTPVVAITGTNLTSGETFSVDFSP